MRSFFSSNKGLAFAIIIIVLFIIQEQPHSPVLHARGMKPKVLIFSAIDIYYVADNVQKWGEDVGANGFLFSHIAEWWTTKEKLADNLDVLREVNRKGAKHGLDSNFIKVAIGYSELPVWTDDKAWANVVENFRNIAELIKQTGTKGIAIDTEPYSVALFDSKAARFRMIDNDILKRKIYQRGREIMQAITEVFQDIEVIILPEGAFYWFNPDQGTMANAYELWIDFFDGMASVKNRSGIVVAGERTYSVVDRLSVIKIYRMTDETMQTHAKDPAFWKEKCSIALGMWPLGKEYHDKSARYPVSDFREQFAQAAALSPKYVWIYDHGTAWFQLSKEEAEKYTKDGRWIWEKRYQVLPAVPNIDEYYTVLREHRKR